MREIKFLAYVNNPIHGKGVFPVKSIHFEPFVCEVVMGDEIVNFFDFDDITLLQYTGLCDKNGKEIYEGDIVIAWSAGVKAVCEVKWGRGRAGFFLYRKPNIAWNLSGGGKDYNEENVEVIGNRYTHPHLLGGEEE